MDNHRKWMFNIKKLGEVLSGNTFTDKQGRNFFEIIYEANTLKSLFSGEANDRSLLYIEKVMQVYFYGCSVMLGILKNSMLLTNFTAEDIEALSPFLLQYTAIIIPAQLQILCILKMRLHLLLKEFLIHQVIQV